MRGGAERGKDAVHDAERLLDLGRGVDGRHVEPAVGQNVEALVERPEQEAVQELDIVVEPGSVTPANAVFMNGAVASEGTDHPEEAAAWIEFLTGSPITVETRLASSWELPAVNDEAAFASYLEVESPANREAVFAALDNIALPLRVTAADGEVITVAASVDVSVDLPNLTIEWMMGNVSTLLAELGDRWPGCAGDLTEAIEDGLRLSQTFYNLRTAATAEKKRLELTAHMAALFDQVDLVMAATNPGPAFDAESVMSSSAPPVVDKVMTSKAGRTGLSAALARS